MFYRLSTEIIMMNAFRFWIELAFNLCLCVVMMSFI